MFGFARNLQLAALKTTGTSGSVGPLLISRTMKTATITAAESIQFPFWHHQHQFPMDLRRRRFGTSSARNSAPNEDDKAMEQFFGYKVKSNPTHYKEIEQRILRVAKEIAPKFGFDPTIVEEMGLAVQISYYKRGSRDRTMEMLHALEDEFGFEFDMSLVVQGTTLAHLYSYICHELDVTIGEDAKEEGQKGDGADQGKKQHRKMPGHGNNS